MDATVVLPPALTGAPHTHHPHVRSPHRLLVPRSQLRQEAPPSMTRSLQTYADLSPRLLRDSRDTDGVTTRDHDATSSAATTLDAHTLHAWSATSSLNGGGGHAPGSAASSTASFELKRESSEDRERLRCDSTLTNGDARLSICSTSGTVYESVVVVGHMYGSDNVVYYLLEVKSWEMPLEGYVIRRRYNDFKQLHQELALHMPQTGGVRKGMQGAPTSMTTAPTMRALRKPAMANPFGIYSSSLLCTGLASARPETSPLWSPTTRPAPPSHRRSSIPGFRLPGLDETGAPRTPPDPHEDYDTRFSAPIAAPPQSGRPQWSTNHGFVDLPFHNVSFDRDGRPLLPSMPPGGVSSFFSSREMLIKYRIEKFNRLLAAVLSDTSAAVAELLMNFIQDKPSAPQTYVSLNQYAPVEMPWSVERYARRRATMTSKREKAFQAVPATAG